MVALVIWCFCLCSIAGDAPITFRNNVQPVLAKAGCNAGACHGAAAGQNGFKLSLRGYDAAGMMLISEVLDGSELEEHLSRFFADPAVEYIHIHNARPGCYNCRVDRAE